MLKLQSIVKNYDSGANTVYALRGVSIAFRASEFVAILGHSGCGKTTLLNIIGGLDRYTSGDLIIRGRSTKEYKNRDWDAYRNHSVGFVFQSYNLIPHQSVLANVELALTLSGVGRAERRRRATEALSQVGLADQLHKRPNQLSGGQMQRVAIARALVNDPEILLADEPTGALDSETSVQVMDLLRQIAQDRLVIMVTHNPDLAERYATRTVRLLDGQIISDSNPYDGEPAAQPEAGQKKHTSMSALTAFSLSLNNLMTKKARTFMTAFAGSIGIVGIALILSLSSGINRYIADVEKDTLSSYPIQLQSTAMDMSAMIGAMDTAMTPIEQEPDKIYSSNVMTGMMNMMLSGSSQNNLTAFKEYIESGESGLEPLTSEIRYVYSTPLNIYKADTADGVYQVNPNRVFSELGVHAPMMGNRDVWSQLTDNTALLDSQYTVLSGKMPESWDEVALIVDENNRITDFTLYSLGLLDMEPLREAIERTVAGEKTELDTDVHVYEYSDFVGLEFKLVPTPAYYEKQDDVWVDRSEDTLFLLQAVCDAPTVTVTGVLRPQPESTAGTAYGGIGYTGELMLHMIDLVEQSEAVQEQRAHTDTDLFTGLPFANPDAEPEILTMAEIQDRIADETPERQAELSGAIAQMQAANMPESTICETLSKELAGDFSASTLEENLSRLGVSDLDAPSGINLYPIDFETKDAIADIISDYNSQREEAEQITYTDYVGLMMRSITTIINAISYILIAFVAISLVVSSIMIGIITNISVLERTKEIGILRAVGASRRDISRVFNAETILVGLAAGLVGIGLTELLIVPINAVIRTVTDIGAKAYLNPWAAVILVGISMFLTYIAGLFPAHSAAVKDPVVALRTE